MGIKYFYSSGSQSVADAERKEIMCASTLGVLWRSVLVGLDLDDACREREHYITGRWCDDVQNKLKNWPGG